MSPATLFEAHAAVVRWRAEVTPLGQPFAAATALGIPGVNYNSLSGGLPGFTISNFSALGDTSTYPENSYITTFQYDGDVIHTVGKHTIKVGFLFLRHRFNGFSAFPVRGNYDFNGQFTRQIGSTSAASALADFALGRDRRRKSQHPHRRIRHEDLSACTVYSGLVAGNGSPDP